LCIGFLNFKLEDIPSRSASQPKQTIENMNSFVSIFEIPVEDLSRSIGFYECILAIKIEKIDIPEMQMGLFPSENQASYGVLVKGKDYTPSADGVTIYLNAGDDLQVVLDRIAPSGGKIIVPKTPHGDDSGFFALFLDSEGNKMGLHSLN